MKEERYKGKQALVIGLGMSGQSASHFLLAKGAYVHAVDSNLNVLHENKNVQELKTLGLTVELDTELTNLSRFDFVVVSPGVPQTHPLYRLAQDSQIEMIGEIELGCRAVSNPMIGITGTNGKTTVTSLVSHVLKTAGLKAKALGNVGVPLTKEVLTVEPDEILVLELSSYQLETLSQKVLDAAVILNITPDHLDRYGTMEPYAQAKFLIQRCLKEKKPLYLEEKVSRDYGHLLSDTVVREYGYSTHHFMYAQAGKIWVEGKEELTFADSQAYRGHHLENIMAAYALCREFQVSSQSFLTGLQSFKKPPHRIEFVLEKNGISYYDDSKGTNIDAVCRAVQSLPGSIVLIAGGLDKGASYTPWIESFANKVKYICAIGQAAAKIQAQLSDHIPVWVFATLELAVRHAAEVAQYGDTVLLSPGCASWDMFKDYIQRGKEFQRVVREL